MTNIAPVDTNRISTHSISTQRTNPRTSSASFHNYRDTTNASNITHSTNTTTTNELERTTVHKPRVVLQEPRLNPRNEISPNQRHEYNQQAQITERQKTTRAEIHAPSTHRHTHQTVTSPTQTTHDHYLIDLETTRPELPERDYPPEQTHHGRSHQRQRIPTPRKQKVMEEIDFIINNDQFVEDLNRKSTQRYSSGSDTDSNQEFNHKSQTQHRYHPQSLPRHKSPLPRPISPKYTYGLTMQQHGPMTGTIPKSTTTRQQTRKFKIVYDDENLLCQGQGWKKEFLDHAEELAFETAKNNILNSNATVINTNNPFADLHTQLTTEKADHPSTTITQMESMTTSSTQSQQNPLTSTFNESIHYQNQDPPISPILTPTQIKQQTAPHATNQGKTIQTQKQNEPTNDESEQIHRTITDSDTEITKSPQTNQTVLDQTNGTMQQYDGNTSMTELNTIAQNAPTAANRKNKSDIQLERQIAHQLKNIKPANLQEKLQAKQDILTEATKHYDDTEPKSKLHRKIERKLNETKQLSEHYNNNETKKLHTHTNSNNKNDQTSEDEDDQTQIQDNPETPDYDDPETAKAVIKRNREILSGITNYTQNGKALQEVENLEQQIQSLTLQLNKITSQITNADNPPDIKYFNDFADFEPHEETEHIETSQVPLNVITPHEFREIEANLHHRCKDKFEQARDNYDQTALSIEDVAMNIREKLYTQNDSPQLANLVDRTKNHLINLRKRQVNIEKNIRKLTKWEKTIIPASSCQFLEPTGETAANGKTSQISTQNTNTQPPSKPYGH